MPLESIMGQVEEGRIKRIEGKGMKNQKGRRVKMDIFGFFDKHFIRKKIFLWFCVRWKLILQSFRELFCFYN